MQIYFKTIYFVLSGYLHWFRFRKRMWMSTRSMAIYVARFCDHLFTLSSVRSFIQFIHIFVRSLVGFFARICTFVATILFLCSIFLMRSPEIDIRHELFCLSVCSCFSWKTARILFRTLVIPFPFVYYFFTSLVHTKRVLNHSLPEFPFRSQLFSMRVGCLYHRFNTIWMPFFILCQTLTLYVYV